MEALLADAVEAPSGQRPEVLGGPYEVTALVTEAAEVVDGENERFCRALETSEAQFDDVAGIANGRGPGVPPALRMRAALRNAGP